MNKPHSMMMWKASDKLSTILSTEYLLGGSTGINLWTVENRDFEHFCSNLEPGSIVALYKVDEDGKCYIIGGGYFLACRTFDVKVAWQISGVRNGAVDYEDFKSDIIRYGGNENSKLISAIAIHSFLFEKHDYVLIPEEISGGMVNQQYFSLDLNEPVGRYLRNRIIDTRDMYIGSDGTDWMGMYYVASHRNSKSYYAEFHARVMAAYKSTCAVTGNKTRPVLNITHIQPYYDDQFQSASNGIVLRSDLNALFKRGYITFVYVNDGKKLVVKVSDALKANSGEEYLKLDGANVTLPDEKEHWPNPKYVTWHNKFCFEYWLRVGGSHS